jgi:Domain of Unknown Function with PDB structure (DUF3857)
VTLYSKTSRGIATALLLLFAALAAHAQAASTRRPEKTSEKAESPDDKSEKAANPFLVQLLETHFRFEATGDSRKEVHTVVKLNNLVGAQEFARLAFDYDRSFQQIQIPMVRITHANGGTSDVMPSAITDAPNRAVSKYPDYQDVRVKAVRILGLQEGDTIEYRVITTTTHAPLAPEFWLEHNFDRSGQVLQEEYELELPKMRKIQMRTAPEIATGYSQRQAPDSEHVRYHWQLNSALWLETKKMQPPREIDPDIVVTSFASWGELRRQLTECVQFAYNPKIRADAMTKVGAPNQPVSEKALYSLVSSKIETVELPLTFASCPFRQAEQVLSSGYGSPQDKAKLLSILLRPDTSKKSPINSEAVFYTRAESPETKLPRPSLLNGILVLMTDGKGPVYLDPSLEVAPYGMIPDDLRGRKALRMGSSECQGADCWTTISRELPFAAYQKVAVNATVGGDGKLSAKVKYTMRGENELLLRVAFHKTPKEKWKDVAGLLALSDGFRGVITAVDASDPTATNEPFRVEYELTQDKFVDWAKKPVRIPALLPQIGLPDTSSKTANGNIELGTPLDVETQLTLHLPAGTLVQTPAGTSVVRDYATYSSKYELAGDILSASRRIHFLKQDVAGDRAVDYNAFERAVQNDQGQYFVLDGGATSFKAADLK